MDLTRHPILVSVSAPACMLLQFALSLGTPTFAYLVAFIGGAIGLGFAAQVFFRANRYLKNTISPVLIYSGLGAWPFSIIAIMASDTINAAAVDAFERTAVALIFAALGLTFVSAAIALEHAEKGEAKPAAVAGSVLQLSLYPLCAVRLTGRLERLDTSPIWWK